MTARMNLFPVLAALVLVPLLLLPVPSRAARGDSADTVSPGHMMLGLKSSVYTRPGVTGIFTLGLGLTPWMSVGLDAGYGTTDLADRSFVGGIVFKALVTKNFGGMDQFSVLLGADYDRYPAARLGIMLATEQKLWTLYTGLDGGWAFRPETDKALALQFLLGVKTGDLFPSATRFRPSFIFEVGVPLTNDTSFTFTLAGRVSFDLGMPGR